jgi:outer membrane lipoprotein-sorting protein
MLPTLLLMSLSLGQATETELVIGKVRDHFERITSIHIQGTQTYVESGGLWADDPMSTPPVYDPKIGRAYDIWLDPPRQYSLKTETRGEQTSTILLAFDGTTYTYLNLATKSGLVTKDSSLVKPPTMGPLQAIGFCFPGTDHSSLAALLVDPSKVKIQPVPGGRKQWLIEVKSLPDDVKPSIIVSDKARSSVVVRMWITVDPEVQVNKWGIFVPHLDDPRRGKRPIPSLQLEGYDLNLGFVNCDYKPAHDEMHGRNMMLPTRTLHGNGNFACESMLQKVTINPKPSDSTFLPALPDGFSITHRNP